MGQHAAEGLGWRDPGGVVLVACYEQGHQPLSLASVLPHFRAAGFDPVLIDVSTERFDPATVARARFVGISVPMHTALRIGVRVADEVRRVNGSAHIVFFGLYAALNREFLLERVGVSCLGGETDGPLVARAERLAALEGARSNDFGLGACREKRSAARGDPLAAAGVLEKPFLSALPVRLRRAFLRLPASLRSRHARNEQSSDRLLEPSTSIHLDRPRFMLPVRDVLPPLKRYARLEIQGRQVLAAAVEASRGCLHTCRHCPITPIYKGRFFAVPEEIVLADIASIVAMGAGHVTFADPDFLNGPTHALRIARALHARWPALSFDFTAKVEHLLKHAALVEELASLGCVFVVTAVESFSDVVLENLHKGHTREGAIRALRQVRAAGLAVHPSFVPFTPWTTHADYLTMLSILEDEHLVDSVDPVQLAIRLLVPPGSALLSAPVLAPYLGPIDRENFVVPWRHPDPQMDALHEKIVGVVAEAAVRGDAPRATFRAVARAAGCNSEPRGGFFPHGDPPPRLTEPWFC